VDERDVDDEWVALDSPPRDKVAADFIDTMPHAKLVDPVIDVDGDLDTENVLLNDTMAQRTHRNELRVEQYYIPRESEFWSTSQVSLPKGSTWGSPGSNSFDPAKPNDERYTYNYDIADASDTYVYAMRDYGIWGNHVVSLLTHV
jgi:hypothetical protein